MQLRILRRALSCALIGVLSIFVSLESSRAEGLPEFNRDHLYRKIPNLPNLPLEGNPLLDARKEVANSQALISTVTILSDHQTLQWIGLTIFGDSSSQLHNKAACIDFAGQAQEQIGSEVQASWSVLNGQTVCTLQAID